uniref:KAT8 regulatory NSL complex subunit 2 n=1 Tax=Timema bartmani TaxID=61472 RepID=A0A7R9EQ69_9NEOP|nr:unnamed protein product [Timema bartmani]
MERRVMYQAVSGKLAPVKTTPKQNVMVVSQCRHQQHTCTQATLEGYNYCLRHILEDKTAPYKQCNYVYAGNGRRCVIPTARGDKSEFCAEHARKAQLARQKSLCRHVPPTTPESLLVSLGHYSRPANALKSSVSEDGGGDAGTEGVTIQPLNPFVNTNLSKILDYASESDSDVEPATVDSTWHADEIDSSDADSVDSQQEDPLKYDYDKHAGVYTAEEVAQVTRDKLIRLQSLYIEQFRRLQHVLKERRRKYLHTLKKEKETLSSIHNQPRETVREQKMYAKLKALNRYHRRTGVEAVLHKKALERRALATEGLNVRPPPMAKCIFTEGGVKCGERTLPVAKHCKKHILEDIHQVLFRPCGCMRSDFPCREPVLNIFDNTLCVYHTNLPPPSEPMKTKEEPVSPDVTTSTLTDVCTKLIECKGSDEIDNNSSANTSHPSNDGDSLCLQFDTEMKEDERTNQQGSESIVSETATEFGSSDTTLTAHSDMEES